MRKFLLISSLILLTTIAGADSLSKIKQVIRREMDNPAITELTTPIPGLAHASAYEKAWLVEDPLIPVDYYCYKNGDVRKDLLLEEITYAPSGEEEAGTCALWLLRQTYPYLEITGTDFINETAGFTLTVTADYYWVHPMYGEAPEEDALFTVRCTNGHWSVSRASDE